MTEYKPEPAEGDFVIKSGGDYTFVGYVVCKFTKRRGETRYVVENLDGVLMIMSHKQLQIINTKPESAS